MAIRPFRFLRDMLDLDETNKTAGYSVVVNATEDGYELADVSGGGAGSDDQTAAEVPFTPAGNIAATDVQAAVEELDSEKAAVSHTHSGADITSGTVADARIASTIARDTEVTAAVASEATARDAAIATHSSDTTSVHGIADTSALVLDDDARLTDSRTPTGAAGGVLSGTYPNPGFAADMATQAELDAHVNDASDAHDASAISIADAAGDFTATDVEGALAELQSDAETDAQNLADHLADTADAHDASAISVADSGGNYTATDVEGVLAEIAPQLGGGGAAASVAIVTYQTAAGNNDGGAATASAWTKYPLSDEIVDADGILTLASSVITLAAGTYDVYGWISLYLSRFSTLRLRNTTDGTTLVVGQQGFFETSANVVSTLRMDGRFTVGASKSLEVQYYILSNQGSNALGAANDNTGEPNVFGSFRFTKVA